MDPCQREPAALAWGSMYESNEIELKDASKIVKLIAYCKYCRQYAVETIKKSSMPKMYMRKSINPEKLYIYDPANQIHEIQPQNGGIYKVLDEGQGQWKIEKIACNKYPCADRMRKIRKQLLKENPV